MWFVDSRGSPLKANHSLRLPPPTPTSSYHTYPRHSPHKVQQPNMSNQEETDTENSVPIEDLAYPGPRRAWSTFHKSPYNPPRRAATDLVSHHSSPDLFAQTKGPPLGTTLMIKKKLCDFCQITIITADKKWGLHHSDHAALRDSARNGCTLCVQLHEDIKTLDATPEYLDWPLYRWNIRSPQKGGHDEEIFASIVFRQAISVGSDLTTHKESNTNLPERTFFLFQQSGTTRPPS
jgi:hypothetical protein